MSNQEQGEELNQLSRLLFNEAANLWYKGLIIEAMAGVLSALLCFLELSLNSSVGFAVVGFCLFAWAWRLKFCASEKYDLAETMRRQSVLSEALNWSISDVQFSDWRLSAGKKVLERLEIQKRKPDYYATKKTSGPKKLLEMTLESAFWTRHLYVKIKKYLGIALFLFITAVVIVFTFSSFPLEDNRIRLKVANFIYLFLPVILSIDVVGWFIKLGQISTAIKDIELDLERLKTGGVNSEQVMRLVSEYNCQVVGGFPIPNWFFNAHYDEISQLWKKYNGG